ncbi:MAG: site-2 protease family protein [Chloroflexi bacterium]|nr:site-2 protease family protein [Chloroflexota bacterium]
MAIAYTTDTLDQLVGRVFDIESITHGGDNRQKYITRYGGHLRVEDSAAAYDELSKELKPYQITPLFRLEHGQQAILLVPELTQSRPSNPVVNLVLFVLTIISVLLAGGLFAPSDPNSLTTLSFTPAGILALLAQGWPFAVSMLAILTAHEFGHYLAGRYHHTQITLPYFIPLPLSPFGTMGAFINMKEPPRNRNILLDIGIAGPLAGLIVAIPVLLYGLSISTVSRLPLTTAPGTGLQMEGQSLLYLLAKFTIFHQWLPAPTSYGNLPPLLYWARYFFTGQPFPLGGLDVMLSPVAWAGWAGILVTSLNLIPAGQLDGGHMLYVLLGQQKARKLLPFILVSLIILGFFWIGWWLWALIIFFLGRVYAEPLDQVTPLNSPRKYLAVLALVIFILVFTPVPLNIVS